MNEIKIVTDMMARYPFDDAARARIKARALRWMSHDSGTDNATALLQGYDLSSAEGQALMELAEAYLRIPDGATRAQLLRDKLRQAGWKSGNANNKLTKLIGHVMKLGKAVSGTPIDPLAMPVMHGAASAVMRGLAQHFVMGETIESALDKAHKEHREREKYSFDMLGEGARTYDQSERYFQSYLHAIKAVGGKGHISIKLSALHPKFEETHRRICFDDLVQKLTLLCAEAKAQNVEIRIDAEEERRLDLMLDLIDAISGKVELQDWNGLGLAVQAYLKRTPQTIAFLQDMAKRHNRILGVRLVKGAYWDSEIKYAQMAGLADFPVYTRKAHTDLSYILCAQQLLQSSNIYPAFGSHNAMTLAAVAELANEDRSAFETQRLVGMGDAIHEAMRAEGYNIGVYAPVGPHNDLLPYLVRRLLENGANTSFVKQTAQHDNIALADPYDLISAKPIAMHSGIRTPENLYPDRKNSLAPDLGHEGELVALQNTIRKAKSAPVIGGADVPRLFDKAHKAFSSWQKTDADERAKLLEKLADTLHKNRDHVLRLLQSEGRKTLRDAIGEWREAIDFCRYYAAQARKDFQPQTLPGPDGESNIYTREGRGVFVCIAPWNFPLAIFLGQCAASLAAGNCVIAKPAEQTPKIGALAIDLAHRAGFPKDVVQVAQGDGKIGAELVNHPHCAGVAFTGSYDVGKIIQRALAAKDGPIVPLIAETAGLNACAIDSSALPEQAMDDIILSAFGSAGQRCSALRILLLDDKATPAIIPLLKGAMEALTLGDPFDTATDVGPLIDGDAAQNVREAVQNLKQKGAVIYECTGGDHPDCVPPIAVDMTGNPLPDAEIFGPVLQVYRVKNLTDSVKELNSRGYALTFGLHTRLSSREREMKALAEAGNVYINRSMIGAVVGVQPFGGHGRSGTGPKAGGPNTLLAYSHEKHISNNTAAAGGNISLVVLQEGS